MKFRLTQVISGRGRAPHQFAGALRALAFDASGRLAAVGDREVKLFDLDRGGELAARWRTSKFGHAAAASPAGELAVGQDGLVELFDGDGRLVRTFRDPSRLGKVTAIGWSDGFLLLGDATARCIRVYDAAGRWVRDLGADNNTRGFLIPNGRLELAVAADGTAWAIHSAKHRVERYDLAGRIRARFGRFGHRPEDFSGCCNPTNLALLPGGALVVTEKAPPRLKAYDEQGRLLALVGPGAFDAECKNMAVAADARGRVCVADTARLQIDVFQLADINSPPAAAAAAGAQGASLR